MSDLDFEDAATPTSPRWHNRPAPGTPYFTPAQEPSAGTLLSGEVEGRKKTPKLFQSLKIRDLVMQNRIMLSPLDQYSAEDGHSTPWHVAHLGGIIKRGPGLSFVEACAITPEGRVSPQDLGIWKDSHVPGLRHIVDFAHSQGQKIALQLNHSGRKGSTVAPWLARSDMASEEHGGWPNDLLAPSAFPYASNHSTPRAMTLADISAYKHAYAAALNRGLAAGFDVVEIHAAHGYLLHQFMSPISNHRTDTYGGSFSNRIRLLIEVVDLCRAIIPAGMPLFVRVSATDYLEHLGPSQRSWDVPQTVKLAQILETRGVDVLDVSSGGLDPGQKVRGGPAYQSPFAQAVKAGLPKDSRMLVCTVGSITTATMANELLEGKGGKPELDIVAVGRGFQKNPALVWFWAEEMGLKVQVANQIRWGFKEFSLKKEKRPEDLDRGDKRKTKL